MGVPVVTLAGTLAIHRAGVSLLTNAGLPELIANSRAQYVQIAAALARDFERLDQLRISLRRCMLASPLMDARRFTDDLERAYREMIDRKNHS
jgi:predicted O-linked N-acetylglucosamine transferase (SPINDLY family)